MRKDVERPIDCDEAKAAFKAAAEEQRAKGGMAGANTLFGKGGYGAYTWLARYMSQGGHLPIRTGSIQCAGASTRRSSKNLPTRCAYCGREVLLFIDSWVIHRCACSIVYTTGLFIHCKRI